MTEPRITAVIPCFNGAKHLPACVRSVQEQNVPCEIIVVDDGSTDDTPAVAKDLLRAATEPFLIITQANRGQAAARNAGLRAARAPFICFPDVDDEYLPGFFAEALPVLEHEDSVAAVACGIELVGCDRPVEDWQRREAEKTLPGNMVVRTEMARQIGGFPEDPAFRGRAASEDVVFRRHLSEVGSGRHLPRVGYRYRVSPSSHFHLFLDRAKLQDDQIVMEKQAPEELDGSLDRACERHAESVIRNRAGRAAELLANCFRSTQNFMHLAPQLDGLPGFLHPYEGYILYSLAKFWPTRGRVVEIGSFKGRSTCWLAIACKEGGRQPVAAVDTFRGSPEHQPGGTHADPDIAVSGSTLPVFERNLQLLDLAGHVTVHAGPSTEIARTWTDPIRMLFIDGDHSFDATKADFESWSPFVVPDGLVVFHDVGVWPGVTRFFEQLMRNPGPWTLFGQFHTMAILRKTS